MPRRGHSYLRFSAPGQRHGDSIRRQMEWTIRRAAELGVVLDDTRAFADHGISSYRGKNAEVGELARFLDLCERSLITPGSYLFVESLDRLSREDVWDAWELFRRIIQAGVVIVTREPDRIYSRDEIAGNWFMLLEPLFIFARGNNESSTKAMRALEKWALRRATAREGKPLGAARTPCWIQETPEGNRLIPDEVAKIQRIFTLCIAGHSIREISALLNSEGVPCPGRTGVWCPAYVREIIKRRMVIGEYQPCMRDEDGRRVPVGEPIAGFYPKAVEETTWMEAQLAVRQRRGKRGRPAGAKDGVNLFVGMVRDAQTQHSICRVGGQGRCMYIGDPHKGGERINYLRFEACILDTLSMLRPEDVLACSAEQTAREAAIAELAARLISLEHRYGKLQAAAADPEIDEADILPALANVGKERKRVASELERLKLDGITGRAEALAETQSLGKLYRSAEGDEREALARRIRAALPSVVDGIWVLQQRVNKKRYVTHVQIYLLSGEKRCVQLLPTDLHGVAPWQLDDLDFRAGEVCDTATMTAGA